jgi:hypothetical protein
VNKPEELIAYLNNTYGIDKEWSREFEVSAELYGRVCQALINKAKADRDLYFNWIGLVNAVSIAIGPHNGVMFKNVELIIKEDE